MNKMETVIGKCRYPDCDYVRKGGKLLGNWEEEEIEHPLYGRTTNIQAALKDLEEHDCDSHRAAQQRIDRCIRKRNEPRRIY